MRPSCHKFIAIIAIITTVFISHTTSTLLLSSVSALNQTIQAFTTYSFQIDRFSETTDIPAGTELQILFPSQYNSISISNCAPVSWAGATSLACAFSALKLTVSGGFPAASSISQISFNAFMVKNPFPAKQYFFSMRFKYPNGTFRTGQNQGLLTIQPGLATCSISVTGTVSEKGQVVISYSSSFLSYNDPNYRLLLNMNKYYSSDPLSKDIDADITNVDRTYLDAYLFELMVVSDIQISMLMPPSTAPQTNFIYILSQNLQQNKVDYCYLTISGAQPNTFLTLIMSSQQVQFKTSINITFQSNSPLMPSDKIKINFDGSQFNLSQLQGSATFYQGNKGQRTVKKSGNLLEITNFVSVASSNVKYAFTLSDIIMPSSNRRQYIQFTLQTTDDAIRDKQTLSYSSTPGPLTNMALSCITVQIGYTTTCYLSFFFSSKIPDDGFVKISFPVGFSIGNTSSQCDTSGTNIKPKSTCTGTQTDNSISVYQMIEPGYSISAATQINITLKDLAIPVDPKIYTLTVTARQSDESLIDSGSIGLQAKKRALTSISITSTSIYTDTSTTFKATFTLPLNLGYPYRLSMYFPFTNISTISVNNGLLSSSFDGTTKMLTIDSISSNQLSISGFKTHSSTAPVTLNGQISYNSVIYYYFQSYNVAVSQPKTIASFTFTQSNKIVDQMFIGTFVVSGLTVGDIIELDPGYYSITQTDCSTNCQCQASGQIKILSINNDGSGLTEIKVNLNNPSYITKIESTFLVRDSTGNYKKLTKQYQIEAAETNTLQINGTQSNPFYGEESTYTFNVTMRTLFPPSSITNTLQVFVPTYAFVIRNYTCLLGCTAQSPQKISNTIYFFVASTSVRIMIGLRNPIDPTLFSTSITMTSSSLGQMDSGEYIPIHPCTDKCRQCQTANTSYCLNCYNSTIWSYDRLDSNTCVSSCPAGKYLQNSTQSCQLCSSKCLTCSESASHCFYPCNTSYYFFNNLCINFCSIGYYATSDYRCLICQNNCIQCSSATICLQCSNSTYLYKDSCQASCLTGTYTNPLFNQCIDCSQNCLNCDSNGCKQCDTSYFLYLGLCLSQCPEGLFQQIDICQSCQSPCSSCEISSTNCTSCVLSVSGTKYYYLQNQCYSGSCPSTYYISSSTNQCLKCNSPCDECTASKCLTCLPGFNFFEGLCLVTCPDGTYLSNSMCKTCVSPCSKCSSQTVCLSCISQRYLYGSSCLTACPAGYYKNTVTRTCDQCISPCLTCTNSPTFCLSCSIDSFYNNSCVSNCPQNYYQVTQQSTIFTNKSISICKQCSHPCYNCITTSTRCKSCVDGYALYQQACSKSCPDFYYNKDGICVLCQDPCLLCDANGCTKCLNQNEYLQNQSCVSSCRNLHPNNKTMVCQSCQSPCLTCSWSNQCLSCINGYAYYQNQCVNSCPVGMYMSQPNCLDCPQFCEACALKDDEIRCSSCLNDTLFYGYLCIQECPKGYEIQTPYCVTSDCKSLANCLTCSSLKCLSCTQNYTLNSTTNLCDAIQTDNQDKTLTTVSQLPVPFPFLIAIVAIIVLAFLIRIQFYKMFIVIFIYSFAGIAEAGSLGLWIALILTRGVMNSQSSLTATQGQDFILKIIAMAICGVYALFNLIGVVLYCCVTRSDRKYAVWEKQDNRCSVAMVTIVSLIVSFRFALLKFSKLAHKQSFSAPLSSDSKLSHLTILAYLSIFFISLPAIGLAGYLSYLQVTQNYLFFTCIEVAVVGVIMIIISILQALIPKKYAQQKKQEYKQGFDQDGIDGQSLDQVLDVDIGQEEYYYGQEIGSEMGEQVKGQNTAFDYEEQMERGSTSSDAFGKIMKQKIMAENKTRSLPFVDQRQQLDDILVQAEKLAARLNQPSRPFGIIKRQVMQQLSSNSQDSQSIGSPQEDDEPPPINSPFSVKRKQKNKQPNYIQKQQHKTMDIQDLRDQIEAGLEYNKKKSGVNRLRELFMQIEEQQKEEKSLRERLKKLNEKQKEIKQKQYQKARQLMERNQMAIEDQLAKVARILEIRKEKQKQRRDKMKQLQQERKRGREQRQLERKKSAKVYQKVKSQPNENYLLKNQEPLKEQSEDGVRKIRVRRKQEFYDDIYIDKDMKEPDDEPEQIQTNGPEGEDDAWLNQQKQVNFLLQENWEMAPDVILQQDDGETGKQMDEQNLKYRPQMDPDGQLQENVEIIHWPIDPELQQKINEVEQRANYYIKRKRQRSETQKSASQQLMSNGEVLAYEIIENDENILSEDGEQLQSIGQNGQNSPILKFDEKIKIPKGRVNRNIIDLSPNK